MRVDCLQQSSQQPRRRRLPGRQNSALASRDAEPKYHIAGALAVSGYKTEALRVLRRGIEQNYCSYPAMDTDPYFAGLRGTPEFAAVRAQGIECQRKLLAYRAQRAR